MQHLRIPDPVALLGLILLAVLVAVIVTSSDREGVAQPPPAIESEFRLGWNWEVNENDPDDQILVIEYEDGRFYMFRDRAITAAKFYPTHIAKKLGNKHPYIEIFCGPSVTRLDVTNVSGRLLVERITKEINSDYRG